MQTANVNLPVTVTGRHVDVTDSMKNYAVSKIEGLHLDYPRIIEAQVILDVEKYRHQAEVILHCANHITIEASAETDDMYASMDEVMGKIARQMRKYKTRMMRNHRPRPREDVWHFEERVFSAETLEALEEENEPQPIKTEKYPMKQMFTDEAILQLEMSSRQFVVFVNARTEKLNILFRRKNGAFGLIEPTYV
jgi:putative sigma-54 modulation protein